MGKIVTNGQLATTLLNVQSKFLNDFDSLMAVQGWRDLVTVLPSNTATEQLAWFGKTPQMADVTKTKVSIGGASPYSYSLTSRTWQAGISFEREWWEDDKLGFSGPLIAALSEEAVANRGRQVFGLLTSGGLAYDGTAFFSDSRTQGDSGTIDNNIGYTAASATTLTQAEVSGVVKLAQQTMAAFKDDKGNVQAKYPDTFVVPVSLYHDFWQGLATANQMGSIAAIPPTPSSGMVMVGGYKLCVNHVSSSASVVYALRTMGTIKPFVFLERQTPAVDGITNVNSKEWMIDREIPYVATDRFEVGYGDPRDALKITIST